MQAIKENPVMAEINADFEFVFYTGGILDSVSCTASVIQPVLIVGYGQDATTNIQYYIVKNSWGTTWGENGYARIKINPDKNDEGVCGI